jgi:hypothetical protein
MVAQLNLDSRVEAYLYDHMIEEKAVLPLAVATELMAATAATTRPGWVVSEVQDLRLFEGVIISADYREIIVRAEPQSSAATESQLRVTIQDPTRTLRPLYQSTVILVAEAPAPYGPLPDIATVEKRFPKSIPDSYKDWMFHGPVYHSIDNISGYDHSGIDALINGGTEGFTSSKRQDWHINPLIVDTVAQMATLWSRVHHDTTLLPAGIKSVRCYPGDDTAGSTGRLEVITRFQPGSGAENYNAKSWVLSGNQVILEIDSLTGFGNQELNRIAGDRGTRPLVAEG